MRPIGVPVLDEVVGGIAPGLPLVVAGPSGSGRTVLALEILAAALAQGDVTTLLCAEPAPFVLQQARTLGLDLEPALGRGQLVMLETDPRIAALVRTQGIRSLAETLRAEEPLSSLLVVDPFTALTAELMDEPVLRATVREFVGRIAPMRMVLTLEAERLELQGGLERALGEVCGVFVRLSREASGRRSLALAKTRAGVAAHERVTFAIDGNGTRLVEAGGPPDPPASGTEATGTSAPASQAAAPPADASARREASARAEESAPTVLVVDADRAARELVAKWLRDRFEVVTAGDGFEAMTTLLTHRPCLVILDLVMPKVTGFEVLSAFQRAAPEIPLLVVSSSVRRPRDRLAPIVLGATDVMTKPVERFELVHKVDTLLRLRGAPPHIVDPAEAQALFGAPAGTRVLEMPEFDARLARACSFGERFGLPSALVLVSAGSAAALDRLLVIAEENLRYEDAVLRVSARRAAVLLVACEPAEAPDAVERLAEHLAARGGRAASLRWRVCEARPLEPGQDWGDLFRSVDS